MKSALIITSLINDAVRIRRSILEAPYDMIITCLAYSRGAGVITIVGGLGGRFDHTMANIGLMSKFLGKADIFILDGDNFVRMLAPGEYKIISAGYTYLGLIAYGGPVKELTLSGTYYPLENHDLTPDTSLAISNEIVNEPATVKFTSGQLLVIQSDDAI